MDQWASLLADAAVAASGPDVAAAHKPLLFAATSSSALHSVEPYLRRAWPAVLDALTLSMQQDPGARPRSRVLGQRLPHRKHGTLFARPLLLPRRAALRAPNSFWT